jgi:hypothetical protein
LGLIQVNRLLVRPFNPDRGCPLLEAFETFPQPGHNVKEPCRNLKVDAAHGGRVNEEIKEGNSRHALKLAEHRLISKHRSVDRQELKSLLISGQRQKSTTEVFMVDHLKRDDRGIHDQIINVPLHKRKCDDVLIVVAKDTEGLVTENAGMVPQELSPLVDRILVQTFQPRTASQQQSGFLIPVRAVLHVDPLKSQLAED